MSVYSPVFYSFSFRASFPDTLASFQTSRLSFFLSPGLPFQYPFLPEEHNVCLLAPYSKALVSGPPFQTSGFFSDTRASFFWTPGLRFWSQVYFSRHQSFILSWSPRLSFYGLQASFQTQELSFFWSPGFSFLVSMYSLLVSIPCRGILCLSIRSLFYSFSFRDSCQDFCLLSRHQSFFFSSSGLPFYISLHSFQRDIMYVYSPLILQLQFHGLLSRLLASFQTPEHSFFRASFLISIPSRGL